MRKAPPLLYLTLLRLLRLLSCAMPQLCAKLCANTLLRDKKKPCISNNTRLFSLAQKEGFELSELEKCRTTELSNPCKYGILISQYTTQLSKNCVQNCVRKVDSVPVVCSFFCFSLFSSFILKQTKQTKENKESSLRK